MSDRKTDAPEVRLDDPGNPEWTGEDFANALPRSEWPDGVEHAFTRTRGPQKASTKVPTSIRLSAEVVEHFKSGGSGWQTRIDEVLRRHIARERERTPN